jgi:hypothetical protein
MSIDKETLNHLKLLSGAMHLRKAELEKKTVAGKKLPLSETLHLKEINWLLASVLSVDEDSPFIPGEPSKEEIKKGRANFKKGLDKLPKSELIEKLSQSLFELEWERKTVEHLSRSNEFLFEFYEESTKKIKANSENRKAGKAINDKFHVDKKNLARTIIKELKNEDALTFKKFCARMRKHGEFPASSLREYFLSITGLRSTT